MIDKDVHVAGSDRPEKAVLRIGFMPLADCAPLVMASVLGFDEKYGIKLVLEKQHSWSAMRDRLTNGELDAAHALYGLLYGLQMGIGGAARDMAVLMNLNQNGQSIVLARAIAAAGVTDGAGLRALMHAQPRRYTFGHTFPTGNHAMWLCYWLAAAGIDPITQAQLVTVPPAQMAPNLEAGHMDGFCAGEPWSRRALIEASGMLVAPSSQVWPDHPGKALGARADFVARNPNSCRALVAALLETARWLDASPTNREAAAEVLASPAWVGADLALLRTCLLPRRADFPGLRFFGGGEATFPWLSDGMWFLTQQRRWGLLREDPAYLDVACAVNQIGLYREAAALAGVDVPAAFMRSSRLMDGRVWDGSDPVRYAGSFDIHQR
ncbi:MULTISPECIES: CmpA/NrtA family ABC transporter substrate-binding protein [unclassified Massilia]|uniref:CmpA/NrtA family ABC transporter substrate-binding protein n=1 Tax=unclassified Massilia TaxID=2609279 RepID=UPI00177E0A65|nr:MULTISPECIES: CmpA/NrtA family ABC transporter substrate-binding protein [unclassified Massilia]MBD8529079.1 ABC transporter substrate-binding protein [Massilia sp. CFBP 13647]MBD8672473.1 ABC transporter substrate-binding protein [Massilia sp. CFBP 13721]